MGYHEDKRDRDLAPIRALHPSERDETLEPDTDAAPSFDGGVRTPAPQQADPDRDHAELVADLVRAKQIEGPSGWRPPMARTPA